MLLKQGVFFVLGVVGLAALSVSSPKSASAQGEIPKSLIQAGAPAGGVVMVQDDAKVYIYDGGKDKIMVLSKSVSQEGLPETWVINTKTMSAAQVNIEKAKG